MRKVSARWYSFLLGAAFVMHSPGAALAQTSLTWAKVERLRNRVHLIPRNRNARLARVEDVMTIGDSLRTASSSRAELRFNDGSLARVGEQATFRFTPNTRNFQLSNGTVLLLIPPGRGRTTIQTPNAVTGIQGSALFVRAGCLTEPTIDEHCDSPITLVGALTNNPAGPMIAYNETGSQRQPIYAGEMVVVEDGLITQLHEFDLRTFYETSGLVDGLQLDSPIPPENLSEELREVWQEIQDALESQGDFDDSDSGQEVVVNPGFVSSVVNTASEDTLTTEAFSEFPGFESSPAAFFHSLSEQPVATLSSEPISESLSGNGHAAVPTNQGQGELPVSTQPNAQSLDRPASSVPISTPSDAVPTQPEPAPAVVESPQIPNIEIPTSNPGNGVTPPSTPEVPIAPENPAPVVEQPDIPEATREPVAPPPTVVQPEPVAVEPPAVPEADEIPERRPVPEGSFDWDQQPEGANNPEVVLPVAD